jgi:hypothetical protein
MRRRKNKQTIGAITVSAPRATREMYNIIQVLLWSNECVKIELIHHRTFERFLIVLCEIDTRVQLDRISMSCFEVQTHRQTQR